MIEDDPIYADDFHSGEEIRNLYIGRFDAKRGVIVTDDQDGGVKEHPAVWWGAIWLYAESDESNTDIRQLGRVSMYGQLVYPDDDPRIGTLSLASIVRPRDAPYELGEEFGFQWELHYAQLTRMDYPDELDNLTESDLQRITNNVLEQDPVSPRTEQISGLFTPQIVSPGSQQFTLLINNLETGEFIESVLGVVLSARLDPLDVEFYLSGTGDLSPKPTYSLPSHCQPPEFDDCNPATNKNDINFLPIYFINSSSYSLQDSDVMGTGLALEELCLDQIKGACLVWRKKSCLELIIVQQEIVPGNSAFAECGPLSEISIKNSINYPGEAIEIFLVDQLTNRPNGGITHDEKKPSAYCILALEKMIENPYLLAHELCHIIGLSHPGIKKGIEGSIQTVAHAGNPVVPELGWKHWQQYQSEQNLGVFTNWEFPLNSIVTPIRSPDCFRPDS